MIIICSSNNDDLKFVNALSESLGCDYTHVRSIDLDSEVQKNPDYAALIVGFDATSNVQALCKLLVGKPYSKTHVIIPNNSFDLGKSILEACPVGSLIFRKYGDFEVDGVRYARAISNKENLERPGLQNILKIANIKTVELLNLNRKTFLSDTVLFHLKTLGCSERVAEVAASATDELLLRAITSLRGNAGSDNKINLQIGAEDNYIGVGVTSLQKSEDHASFNLSLIKAFTRLTQPAKLEHFAEGDLDLSLGLSLILKSGLSLSLVCMPQRYFHVSLLLERADSLIEFRNQFQFLSTFFTS